MKISSVEIQVVQGDITRQEDLAVIVNAANSSLRGGGGVDGAIHRAAGPELKKESSALAPIGPGQAVITGAYRLPNRFVIHCVGPVYGVHKPEEELLASCYRNALRLAEKKQVDSIAFPAISTGVYAYPMREAAQVMFKTIIEAIPALKHIKKIRIVLFDRPAYELHLQVLEAYQAE
ncbi:macro domain-containing protein [Syntrophomonas wolfei]|jgi:O-acetyl-ADP-ribose deacetylase (regulator of RNase III)|uniref:macro domain-containing protein n=1 Tax=Syntrophomonas wolfei TaxID=863 RepID=UPI0023F169C3|nr:macro domain-containing protein [Syntrophomonas wolfei]